MLQVHIILIAAIGMAAVLAVGAPDTASAQMENPREILAVRVRSQGYPCGKPLTAEREPKLSEADSPAWVLHCDNASYRIVLRADMAAYIERLNQKQ